VSEPAPTRLARLSYFFPAHNEAGNLGALVEEALAALPEIAATFEIVIVDDGSRDATPRLADALAAEHEGVVRVVHHATNLGYGAALRSGFAAARHELIAFTDGDRQFRVADLGLLTARLAAADAPDVVAGFRVKRADPSIRSLYASLYRLANRIFFDLRLRDVDCACKLFRRADILVVDDRTLLDRDYGEVPDVIDRFLPSRPVYVMRASGFDLGPLLRRYELEALPGDTLRNVYRVVGLKEPAG